MGRRPNIGLPFWGLKFVDCFRCGAGKRALAVHAHFLSAPVLVR
jgi:hypothetical protein